MTRRKNGSSMRIKHKKSAGKAQSKKKAPRRKRRHRAIESIIDAVH
jgi:hypothetical protein